MAVSKPTKRKNRRTNKELFLDHLNALSGGEPKLVGNQALRDRLGWEVERYSRIKDELHDAGLIITGRGRGGTVGLSSAPGTRPLSVFVSYSHVDESLKNALVNHMRPLERINLVSSWHDRKLKAGEEWGAEISQQLESADIVLLLISIDFINSKYCYEIELERALEMHAEGSSRVIPIIARQCMWQHTPFAKLQALPKDGKAITSWTDQDEALTQVAEGIRVVAEELLNRQ